MLKWWWRMVGPNSPVGAMGGGALAVLSFALMLAVVLPPLMWLGVYTLGPWWHYWGIH